MNDAEAIERCIELAAESAHRGNHPFGALLLRDGQLIAEGDNRVLTDMDPTGHAEVVAIRNAWRALGALELADCTLYSSCEPCMICSTVIRLARIPRVVFAAHATSDYGGYSSKHPILRIDDIERFGPPPAVVAGLLADRSLALWAQLGWPEPGH
jgi:tRNA(Arg) A34 adenosine deaminase TadA